MELNQAAPAQTDPDWLKQKLAQFESAPQPVRLTPKPGPQSFNISGDARRVYDAIGSGFTGAADRIIAQVDRGDDDRAVLILNLVPAEATESTADPA